MQPYPLPNRFTTIDLYKNGLNTSTEYSTNLVALKDGNIFPVTIWIGSSYGLYFKIDNKTINIYEKYFNKGFCIVGGFTVLNLHECNLAQLLSKEITYRSQCLRGVELANARISSYENLLTKYPEYFV